MTTTPIRSKSTAELFDANAERLVRRYFVRKLQAGEDLEDLIQETRLRLCSLPRETVLTNPVGFFYAVARNVCADFVAAERRRRKNEHVDTRLVEHWAENLAHAEADPFQQLHTEPLIDRALATLPAVERTIVVCCYQFEFTHAQTAELITHSTGIEFNEASVGVYLWRARKRIRESLCTRQAGKGTRLDAARRAYTTASS